MTRLRDTLSKLRERKENAWTFEEFDLFLRRYERLGASTIRKRLTHGRCMAKSERQAMPGVRDGKREESEKSVCA
mgnify:CR=1 FL=1